MQAVLPWLLLAALAAGCAPQPDLSPRPTRLGDGTATPGATRTGVTILGHGFFPRAVQGASGAAAALDTTHRAWLDGDEALALTDVTWLDEGHLTATIPGALIPAPGVHDLTVENALGRRGTLTAALVVGPPAVLALSAGLSRARASTGQDLTLTVTARNDAPAGGLGLRGVAVAPAPSVAGLLALPAAPAPFDLAAGESRQVTFALRALAPGALDVGATASAAEAGSGAQREAAAAGAPLLVQARAHLVAALAIPATIAAGAPFQATMTVENDGEATAEGVAPGALAPGPAATGAFTLAAGPAPASADVPGGGRVTFTWTWQLAGAGVVELLGGAGGLDANDGGPVESGLVESNEAGQAPEVNPVAADPFGDGTPAAALATWGGQLWMGPRADGRVLWHLDPGTGGAGVLPLAVAVDGGATPAENVGWRGSPTADTFGTAGCVANSTGCGPANENGRGLLAAGTFRGDDWLLSAGASNIRARYAYLARSAAPPIAFAAVDLGAVLPTTAIAPTAVAFAPSGDGSADRVYLAFTDQDAKKSPHLLALGAAPAGPVLDAAAGDLLDLGAQLMPGVGGAAATAANPDAEPRVEALAWFRRRLHVVTGGGIRRSTTAVPGPSASAAADWTDATPSSARWTAHRGLPATASSALTPADRAVPATAAYGRCGEGACLWLVRNTRDTGQPVRPQLWKCDPGPSGACDPGTWSLAAPDAAPGQDFTRLGDPTNGAATVLLATDHYLYLGFDNPVTGAQLYRTEVAPAARADFRGRDGCTAGAPGCQGLGGNGLGLGPALPRLLDARAVVHGGATTVYVVAGDGAGALRLFSLPE